MKRLATGASVARPTGGLEKCNFDFLSHADVARPTGGLENLEEFGVILV